MDSPVETAHTSPATPNMVKGNMMEVANTAYLWDLSYQTRAHAHSQGRAPGKPHCRIWDDILSSDRSAILITKEKQAGHDTRLRAKTSTDKKKSVHGVRVLWKSTKTQILLTYILHGPGLLPGLKQKSTLSGFLKRGRKTKTENNDILETML